MIQVGSLRLQSSGHSRTHTMLALIGMDVSRMLISQTKEVTQLTAVLAKETVVAM